MNGKIKTKFAALFAVALMITVCVVPVVDNAGVDAAPVSSSNGEVFEGYDITLYKEGGDYSGLVYYGTEEPAGLGAEAVLDADDHETGYWVDSEGKLITVDMIPGYEVTKETYGFPLIQIVYGYTDAFNNIKVDVKVEQGSTKLFETKFTQSNTSKSQGHFHIHMDDNDDHDDNLGLTPEQMVGDFKVTLTGTQGFATETVTKTVNAGTATIVSGTMVDAAGNAIKSVYGSNNAFVRGLKISYKVDGVDATNPVIVDKDGKFQIYVTPGQDVEITEIGYYNGSGEVPNSYTFTPASYSYGTVNASISKEFKANEYTRTVTINTADSEVISGSATLGLNWYSQTYDSTDNEYVVAAATGTATQLNTAIEDGKIYVTYKAPEDASTSAVTYTYHLIVSLASSGNFSFTTKSVDTDSNDSISTQISGANGTKDATEQNVTLKAKESTIVVKVLSKNGNPAQNVSIKFGWYSQKVNASDSSKYDVVKVTSSGSVKLVKSGSTTDEKGEIQLAYSLPTAAAGVTYYMYVSANVDDPTTRLAGYTFDVGSLRDTSTGGNSISTILNGKSASKAIVDIDDVTLNAKENTYKVSGNVVDKNVTIVYTNPIVATESNGTSKITSDKDGKYSFYIIEGKSTEITPSKTGIDFVPSSYVTPSLSRDLTVDFAKKADDVEPKTLYYKVNVNAALSTGTVVTFEYTVNGLAYTQEITPDVSGTSSVATLGIKAYPTDVIEVSASLDKYQVSAFDGYSAEAVYFNNLAYKIVKMVGGKEVAIPGATFDVTYVVDGVTKIKQMTADENGFAYWASTDANGTVYKDGYAQVAKVYATDTDPNNIWRPILTPEGEQLSYCTYDLGDFYKVTPATVTIDYIAAYNVDDIYGVGGNDIAETYAYETVVGGTVALKAPSIDGFEFVAWMVDGVVVSESADYTLKVDAATCHVDALYSAVHYEEPAEGLSMNVLVIGIVILILGILAVAYGIISKKQ